jgi:transposase, IS30 family
MHMTYTQLSPSERYQISALLIAGHNKKVISHQLGRHRSTIQREILRCRDLPSYEAAVAQERALHTQKASRNARTTAKHLLSHVEHYLRLALSPQQVTGRLEAEGVKAPSIETIYQHILKDQRLAGDLYRHLRCQKTRRKRYASGREGRGRIANRVCIEH